MEPSQVSVHPPSQKCANAPSLPCYGAYFAPYAAVTSRLVTVTAWLLMRLLQCRRYEMALVRHTADSAAFMCPMQRRAARPAQPAVPMWCLQELPRLHRHLPDRGQRWYWIRLRRCTLGLPRLQLHRPLVARRVQLCAWLGLSELCQWPQVHVRDTAAGLPLLPAPQPPAAATKPPFTTQAPAAAHV